MMTEFGKAIKRSDGYYQITTGKNRGKLLHRLIYEKHCGSIPAGFCVHHLDNDKNNNDHKNLTLMTRSQHNSLHTAGMKNPLWGKSKIDDAGGIDYLADRKNAGATISSISDDLGYAVAAPIYQWLKIRNLSWEEI